MDICSIERRGVDNFTTFYSKKTGNDDTVRIPEKYSGKEPSASSANVVYLSANLFRLFTFQSSSI